MWKNTDTTTYAIIDKSSDKTVSGPYPNVDYAMNEANKFYALYHMQCTVKETKTNRIVYEVPG
jgi:hypothetical protein